MKEVEQICTHIAILDHGRCIADGTANELKGMIKTAETVTVEAIALTDVQLSHIRSMDNVFSAVYENNSLKIKSSVVGSVINILHYLESEDISFGTVYSEKPTLNDVFLELTGKDLRD